MGIARFIDHTLLKPEATPADIARLCAEAGKFGFLTVCVNPGYVSLASRILAGTGVGVCAVIGFPLGATLPEIKAAETRAVVARGASEVDMVMNIGWFKAGEEQMVVEDIQGVVRAAAGRPVKVIIEAGLLTEAEKVRATEMVAGSGAGFVKTATGFLGSGATVADVALLARVAGGRIGVKAAGGIRTLVQARALVAAGATRLGTSAGVSIVAEELKAQT